MAEVCRGCGKPFRVAQDVERQAYELNKAGIPYDRVGRALGVSKKTAWKYATRYAATVGGK